jgi:NADPH:quinone reductase-like Zn-dependent oxidoreductase
MTAARVLRFGPPNVITNDDLPQPEPAFGQLMVLVKAEGVDYKKLSTLMLKGADNELACILSVAGV